MGVFVYLPLAVFVAGVVGGAFLFAGRFVYGIVAFVKG